MSNTRKRKHDQVDGAEDTQQFKRRHKSDPREQLRQLKFKKKQIKNQPNVSHNQKRKHVLKLGQEMDSLRAEIKNRKLHHHIKKLIKQIKQAKKMKSFQLAKNITFNEQKIESLKVEQTSTEKDDAIYKKRLAKLAKNIRRAERSKLTLKTINAQKVVMHIIENNDTLDRNQKEATLEQLEQFCSKHKKAEDKAATASTTSAENERKDKLQSEILTNKKVNTAISKLVGVITNAKVNGEDADSDDDVSDNAENSFLSKSDIFADSDEELPKKRTTKNAPKLAKQSSVGYNASTKHTLKSATEKSTTNYETANTHTGDMAISNIPKELDPEEVTSEEYCSSSSEEEYGGDDSDDDDGGDDNNDGGDSDEEGDSLFVESLSSTKNVNDDDDFTETNEQVEQEDEFFLSNDAQPKQKFVPATINSVFIPKRSRKPMPKNLENFVPKNRRERRLLARMNGELPMRVSDTQEVKQNRAVPKKKQFDNTNNNNNFKKVKKVSQKTSFIKSANEELHPSWAARKKQQQQPVAFKGKRIKFNNSDSE